VKPLVIKLRDGAKTARMSDRNYVPLQLKFMREKIRELELLGLEYEQTGEDWESPPLSLPKPGPDRNRMCYALLRMRPLSISCTQGFVIISCGKVDDDKSGWRDD
jgi:hypothetical protein